MAQKGLFRNDDDDDSDDLRKKEPHYINRTCLILFKSKSNQEFAFIFS
jgi:hypothetical protein